MNNITNRRIKSLSSQRLRNVKARIQRLNESSTIIKLLKESNYSFIDHDKGIFRYRALNDYNLSNILTNVKEVTHVKDTTVIYYLDQEGIMCFEIEYTDKNKVDQLYIHDADLKPAIEYILKITFCHTPAQLHMVNRQSFSARSSKRFKAKHNAPCNSQISIDREFNRIILYTEELTAFLAGITHIGCLLKANPEFTWLDSSNHIEEGVQYRLLHISGENKIELLMGSIEYDDYEPMGSVLLEYGGALAEKVNFMLNKNTGAVNEQLLELLNRLNRGKRVTEIMSEL